MVEVVNLLQEITDPVVMIIRVSELMANVSDFYKKIVWFFLAHLMRINVWFKKDSPISDSNDQIGLFLSNMVSLLANGSYFNCNVWSSQIIEIISFVHWTEVLSLLIMVSYQFVGTLVLNPKFSMHKDVYGIHNVCASMFGHIFFSGPQEKNRYDTINKVSTLQQ